MTKEEIVRTEEFVQRIATVTAEELARIIHEGSSRGGADGHGYKAREGRIPQAYSTVRRGIRPSATQQTCPDTSPQQKLHE